ncbi:MAG: hypothetical protein JXB35_12100 [Anaerolineae bacterium]|nr:hypothetical protein [Anaerolineae bacterium]
MAETYDMTAPKMTRVTVRVPKTTLEQINAWVDALGVRRSHFLGIALVAGVRSLIQASAIETVPVPKKTAPLSPETSGEAAIAGEEGPDFQSSDQIQQVIATLQTEIAGLKAEVANLELRLRSTPDEKKRS